MTKSGSETFPVLDAVEVSLFFVPRMIGISSGDVAEEHRCYQSGSGLSSQFADMLSLCGQCRAQRQNSCVTAVVPTVAKSV